jgi:phage regulator Rha-like protein
MPKKTDETIGPMIPTERIEQRIFVIRGQRVMLDSDLAELYGVETKYVVRAVKRNLARFPADFVFLLNSKELSILRCQIGTSRSWGGRRTPPYAFTEHGAIMLASVLNSERAIEASVFVVRAFVKLRSLLATHKEIAQKLTELERKLTGHDEDIKTLFAAMRQLMAPPDTKTKRVGFHDQNSR